jgi:uncharacterized protein
MKRIISLLLVGVLVVVQAGIGVGTSYAAPVETRFNAPNDECTAEVTPLYYSDTMSGPIGGSSQFLVTVSLNPRQTLRVAFYESGPARTGPMWEASGWVAVTFASLLLGANPNAYRISFDIGGRIDGPSAGALTTVAVLSCLLGDTVKPDVTMTGTLNPDGTIGPVGGIYYKLDGALDAGMTIVLIPAGQRYEYVDELEAMADLVARGRTLGLRVVEVSTIYQAYELLTGQQLARPSGQTIPPLPVEAADLMLEMAIYLERRYTAQWDLFDALPEEIQDLYIEWMEVADTLAEEALAAYGAGRHPIVWQKMWEAASTAEVTTHFATLHTLVAEDDLEAVGDYLFDLLDETGVVFDETLERLLSESPASAADVVVLMDAYSNLAAAQGHFTAAYEQIDQILAAEEALTDDVVTQIYTAVDYLVRAQYSCQAALDMLDSGMGFGETPVPDRKVLTTMAEMLRAAAEANLNYLEATYIQPSAQYQALSPEEVRSELLREDGFFQLAYYGLAGLASLEGELETDDSFLYATLGTALNVYAASAVLIARYYALGEEIGGETLSDMLAIADQRAAELLGLHFDEVSVPALSYFRNAREMREKADPESKLNALFYYWQSAVESSLLGWMTGAFNQRIESTLGANHLWVPAVVPGQATADITLAEIVDAIKAQPTLFSETFQRNSGVWNTTSDREIARSIKNRALHIKIALADTVGWSNPGLDVTDFLFEVDAAHVAGTSKHEYGIIFRYVDSANFYYFIVDSDGHYHLYKLVDNQWETIIEATPSEMINTGRRSANKLGVLAAGANIYLFANGELLDTAEDDTFAEGDIALAVSSFDAKSIEIAFDNVEIWDLE